EECTDAGGDAAAVGLAARHRRVDGRAQVRGAGAGVETEGGPQRPGNRCEGRPTGRLAAGDEHGRPGEAAGELVEEPRLAEPRRAEHDGEAGGRAPRPPPPPPPPAPPPPPPP